MNKPIRTISLDVKRLTAVLVLTSLFAAVTLTYIVSLLGYVAPSPSLPFHVESCETIDFKGNPKSIFHRGELVGVKVKLSMAQQYYCYYYYQQRYYYHYYYFTSAEAPLIIVTINHTSIPMFMGTATLEVSPGASLTVTQHFSLPGNAPTGKYQYTVLVWDDWISKGGGHPRADNIPFVGYFTVSG